MKILYEEVGSGYRGKFESKLIWAIPVTVSESISESIRNLDDARADYKRIRQIDKTGRRLVLGSIGGTTGLTVAAATIEGKLGWGVLPLVVTLIFGIVLWCYANAWDGSRLIEARDVLRRAEADNERVTNSPEGGAS